ncbi:NADH:flavin oxidoreductase/NADH oxidase, partial [Streptomyces sp. AC154]
MSALFEPITLRSLVVPNRVWMAPMCQYCAEPVGPGAGVPTDWHFAHLAARGAGGPRR